LFGCRRYLHVRYAANEREVILDHGEAYFEVAKDATRPFRVHAGAATITAGGTAFNVPRSGELVEVAVAEGVVKVDHETLLRVAGRSRKIADTPVGAGFAASIDPNSSQVTPVHAVATDSMASWRSGRLEYLDEPLKFVIEDVNRYALHPIIIGDSAVGEMRLTGTVFERDGTGIVVLRSAGGHSEGDGPHL
jgi:transmembrane sensor